MKPAAVSDKNIITFVSQLGVVLVCLKWYSWNTTRLELVLSDGLGARSDGIMKYEIASFLSMAKASLTSALKGRYAL